MSKMTQTQISQMHQDKIQNLNNQQLLDHLQRLFQYERKLNQALVFAMSELQARKLYLELGYASLFEMLVKHFKLSESLAYQRISTLKLITSVPVVNELMTDGALTLTNAAMVQSFITKVEQTDAKKLTMTEKQEIVASVCHKTQKQAQSILAEIHPVATLPKTKEKQITAEFTQIQVLLNNESMQKLKDLKSLYSHQVPDGNLNQLFAILIHNAIENHPLNRRMKSKGSHSDKHPKAIDLIEVNSESRNTEEVNHLHSINNNLNQQKLEKREINHKNVAQPEQYKEKDQCIINNQFNKEKSSAELQTSKSINNRIRNLHNNISPKHQKKQRQNIPISTKRIIFARANGQCEFHSANGQRCQSRHQLEYDHIQSVSFGGGNSIDNLQLLCRQHNQYKVLHTHGFNYQMRDQT